MSVSSSKYIRRFKSFALIALVFFGIAPILFAAIPNNESNNSFSIYNSDYDGLSNLRLNLESIQSNTGISKYNVTNIISNLNVLNRFNGSGALVIIAPTSNFAVTETISLVLYMLRGGSVIIIDDYGSGNQVLEPIFKAFENIDKFAEEAAAQGLEIPSTTDILSGGANNTETTPSNGTDGGIDSQLGFGAGAPSGFDQGDLMTNMIGDLIKRFAFNTSAVLMDAGSNSDNPARPVLIDFDQTEFAGYTFTQGIERIQMEFGTTISLQLSVTARDEFGNPILDETGNVTKKDVWMPLQKLTGDVIGDFAEGFEFELSLPFFPMYTSKLSWMETNFAMADDGNAVPDVGEWGNSKFATALSIPLIPGMGKLVMISDPSIFINRWTERYDENDNLQLFLNLIDMATSHIELTTGQPQIPVIFDFGHTYQGLFSPALYSTALMKLIAEMSMFPLYAPFVPFAAYGYGKRLLPETRRLRPILLTKRRGEKGHSEFEKKLQSIKEAGIYGEPIQILYYRLKRSIQNDVRYTGEHDPTPSDIASFFADNIPDYRGKRREIESELRTINRISMNPSKTMTYLMGKSYLLRIMKFLEKL